MKSPYIACFKLNTIRYKYAQCRYLNGNEFMLEIVERIGGGGGQQQ